MVNYFSFSLKNLKRRGIRGWLTLLGIFIGIVVVIALVTLGNGFKEVVGAQFGVSSTQTITVQAGGLNYGPPGSTVVNPLDKEDAEAIERLSTIEFAVTRNIEFLEVEYNDKLVFGGVVSIEADSARDQYEVMDLESQSGRLLKRGDLGKVIVGSNYEDPDKNGFDREVTVGKNLLIGGDKFLVIGVLERKGSFFIDNAIMMMDQDLEDLAGYGDEVDIIAVKVKGKDLVEKAKEDIEKLMRNRRDVKEGEEDFVVSTPDALLDQVNSILTSIQIFIIIIASISIVVGAIGIVNTMATSVVERKKEIGIMKAIGARNSHIFLMFLVESGFLGLVGGILGIIFGVTIGTLGIWQINNLIGADTRISINFILILVTLIGSFLIGAVAGIVPAMGATKQSPVEALRG
ncbi:hypothetical protein COU62_01905 [Candidatus Pacearchaeota archaeon CG10_big_fil_rev_8_21_14_0_10_35_219]|nr:ABC transporter permease [Candidatus Pacearchaeota archaeon]OIO42541.1 MAG: hypothetical protein AUJ63_02555 [Candidatus Pacearchaeota archaeon CG1_02_35_32]PIO07946.1 MAG: hypothetical protein COU62_01905 [Candidatus Pacearchaeota archaeon CG10_big_fil_rev_8_21_14_0_10_35_219]PIY81401.1 MAG: hypothetical protein COY79_02715 [Candidatus Pacearchaeota archaeon CG_4_10_14_0_8_um_filter_35_169]PIZ80635.1 MAG: hypothetical protein COY00_00730 [Candidatus Pacearchaeota archaeon CG_4_10_14_0_2_um_